MENSDDFKYVRLPHFSSVDWPRIRETLETLSSPVPELPVFVDSLVSLYSLCSGFKYLKSLPTLAHFLDQAEDKDYLRNDVLPFICKLALEITELFPNQLEILRQNTKAAIHLTKRQVGCLVAHMFLGTITNSNMNEQIHEILNFEHILNFENPVMLEKVKFLMNYFARLQKGRVTFSNMISYVRVGEAETRDLAGWKASKTPLTSEVEVRNEGGIEDYMENSLEVDFANQYIGGGSLLTGCVQEEIRFVVSPECLPSMLLFERFEKNEVGYILGTEQFSKYSGYAWSMRFAGDFEDKLPTLDSLKRLRVSIVALDALCFMGQSKPEQYYEGHILRELNKAFIGFRGDKLLEFDKEPNVVCTGRWGCGAFNGLPQLKFVIQWLAACECGKFMVFYRRGDVLLNHAEELVESLVQKGFTVGKLVEILEEFAESNKRDLFQYILRVYCDKEFKEEGLQLGNVNLGAIKQKMEKKD